MLVPKRKRVPQWQYQFPQRTLYTVQGRWRSMSGMWFGSRSAPQTTWHNYSRHLVCKTKAHAYRQCMRLPVKLRKNAVHKVRLGRQYDAYAWVVRFWG